MTPRHKEKNREVKKKPEDVEGCYEMQLTCTRWITKTNEHLRSSNWTKWVINKQEREDMGG